MTDAHFRLLSTVVAHETAFGHGLLLGRRGRVAARELLSAGLITAPAKLGIDGHLHSTAAGRRALAEELLRRARADAAEVEVPSDLIEAVVARANDPKATWELVAAEHAAEIAKLDSTGDRFLQDVFDAAQIVANSPKTLEGSTKKSIPVTDPDLDAPDGAIVDGFERVGDRWVSRKEER